MEILTYEFMQKAYFAGLLLGIVLPLIGVFIVLRKLSMIGDALSHSSLAGIAAGLVIGFNPIIGALISSIMATLSIEFIRKRIVSYAEVSIVIVLSASIGLAGVLSSYATRGVNFESFLFGSIVSISDLDILLVTGISFLIIIFFCIFFKYLINICIDEDYAFLNNVPVKATNTLFTLMIAFGISIATQIIGALIVSSLLVVPIVCAMQLSKSFKTTISYSIFFSVLSVLIGITLSFYYDIRPGGAIALLNVLFLIIILMLKALLSKIKTAN